MKSIHKISVNITLLLLVVLIILSVYGAFLGADKASVFFNSTVMIVFWFAVLFMFCAGIIFYRSLSRNIGLIAVHIGPILIIAGGMIGSEKGHMLSEKYFDTDKIYSGNMLIPEGYADNKVYTGDKKYEQLPFSVGLKEFKVLYYPQDEIYINTGGSNVLSFSADRAADIVLDDGTRIEIVRKFDNFKIDIAGGKREVADKPGEGLNYAAQVKITLPDGKVINRYAFKPGLMSGGPMKTAGVSYQRTISDYVSEIEIIEDDQVVETCALEVNKPLHYGGYHFYQSSYDDEAGSYTVLSVHSDSGAFLSYLGFGLLGIGIFYLMWFDRRSMVRRRISGT
jgi:hypothetical protein